METSSVHEAAASRLADFSAPRLRRSGPNDTEAARRRPGFADEFDSPGADRSIRHARRGPSITNGGSGERLSTELDSA